MVATNLDNPGNHASVFKINGSTSSGENEPQAIILNGILAYTKFLMSTRDKTFIRDTITSKYGLEDLKKAYKVLFEFSGEKCGYQGPWKNVSLQDKCVDAFDKLYTLLCEYDRAGNTPIIAYPNEELSLFMSGADAGDVHDKRFSDIEASISELKKTFHTFTGLVTTRQTDEVFLASSSVPGPGGVVGPLDRIKADAR